jgi:hypothetical protein
VGKRFVRDISENYERLNIDIVRDLLVTLETFKKLVIYFLKTKKQVLVFFFFFGHIFDVIH